MADRDSDTNSLCDNCAGIIFDDSRNSTRYPAPGWHLEDSLPDLPKLNVSAEAGCSFCSYLIYLIREKIPKPRQETLLRAAEGSSIVVGLDSPGYTLWSDLSEVSYGEKVEYGNNSNGPCYLTLLFSHEDWKTPWRTVAWVYAQTDEVAKYLDISLRLPANHALNDENLALMRKWLSTCQLEHPQCGQPDSAQAFLPTRLIYLGNDELNPKPHLILTKDLSLSTKYIALSYCWGPPSKTRPQLVTVTTTLSAHQTRIPIDNMPLTFTDLISLSFKLGITYLWIDALCIVQDDPEDWGHEAALMGTVYRNAHLTVVAAAGPSCHSGFLNRHNPEEYATIPFVSQKADTTVSGTYLLHPLPARRSWEADTPNHLFRQSWATRAWTLQEDMLSTRVLYFDDKTSYFRCQASRCLENSIVEYQDVRGWHAALSPASGGQNNAERQQHLYKWWERLFVSYAERGLTVEGDKFPALSGLARQFSTALGDSYLAGLWRGNLIRGLLWCTSSDNLKPSSWLAPTWSWMSWKGDIDMVLRPSDEIASSACKIEEVYVLPEGDDPFGRLRGGWLVVSGCIKPVVLKPSDISMAEGRVLGYMDVLDGHDSLHLAQGTLDGVSKSGHIRDGTYFPIQLDNISQVQETFAFLVADRYYQGEDSEDQNFTGTRDEKSYPVGLLITPVDEQPGDDSLRVWKRVGIFTADEQHNNEKWKGCHPQRFKIV